MCCCASILLYFLGLIVAGIAALKLYAVVTCGRYKVKRDMKGKTVLVTGGTSGIGLETCRELAKVGARVYIICRDTKKGETVANEIKTQTGNSQVFVMECDMAKFSSVHEFVKKFKAKGERIDVLINNAGMSINYRQTEPVMTADNLEQHMQANHFSPFLLTNLLLDNIIASAPSRIVNVSSVVHKFASNFDIDNLNFQKSYSNMWPYRWSKLCNILFTRSLDKRLRGKGVTVNSLHPGFVRTAIFDKQTSLWGTVLKFSQFFAKTALEGAYTTLYLAVDDALEHVSGNYFSDCKPAATSLNAIDDALAEKLWVKSAEITGISA